MVSSEKTADAIVIRDRFKPPTLMQVAMLSMAILMILASLVSGVIASRLNHDVGLLALHDTADQVGAVIQPSEPYSITSMKNRLNGLRWITYSVLGASLVAQFLGLSAIIWFVARIIRHQRHDLEQRVRELTSLNQMFRQYLEEDGQRRTPPEGQGEVITGSNLGSNLGFDILAPRRQSSGQTG